MISGASLKRGDFLVEPLFHPSDYGRPNPSILDRRTQSSVTFPGSASTTTPRGMFLYVCQSCSDLDSMHKKVVQTVGRNFRLMLRRSLKLG